MAEIPHDPSIPATSQQLQKLHPAVLRVWRIGSLIAAAVFAAIALLVSAIAIYSETRELWFGVAVLVFPIALCIWSAASFVKRQYAAWRYAVRERDLLVSFGVWWRTRRCIPRARVQHVDISSGPIDRAFGLVEVSVYTAGTIAAVVTIPGVEPREAERLRAQLIDETAQSLITPTEPPHVVASSPVAPGDRAD